MPETRTAEPARQTHNLNPGGPPPSPQSEGAAISLADPLFARVVEAACVQLGLTPTLFTAPLQQTTGHYELLIVDESRALELRATLAARELPGESLNPAIVAVRPIGAPAESGPASHQAFDGLLTLPLTPAAVAAQLSLILYAQRAFAARYQTALEELHLNRRIFRSVTSGISVASASEPDLPLVYVNPAFEVMTGYTLEEVQGHNCRFLQGSEHDQPSVTLLREAIRDQREVVAIIKNFRKNGQPFWNELSLSPIRNRDGELTHFVGIQTDVTARVEFEAALRESEKLAAVGRLASSIAHEINNPLESVMNLLYLAQHGEDPAQARHYIAMADRELKRVALITSQSLRFYKQSSSPQAILPSELLDSVLDLYEGKAENSAVAITRSERAANSIVCLDSEIRQVLSNLVRNALDAMHGSGGRLIIRTRPHTDPHTHLQGVLFTIADTGTGIAPETSRELYKPFFTTKGIAGTGLGLWISSEIISRHGGHLSFRSSQRPGASGTVFQFLLPSQAPIT